MTSGEFLTAYGEPFNGNTPTQGITDAAIEKTLTVLTPINVNEVETSRNLSSAVQKTDNVDAHILNNVDIPAEDATPTLPITKTLNIANNLLSETPKSVNDIIPPLTSKTNPIAETTVKAPQAVTITGPVSTLETAVQTALQAGTVTTPASTIEPAVQTALQAGTVTAPTSTLDSAFQTAPQAVTIAAPTSTLDPAVQTAPQAVTVTAPASTTDPAVQTAQQAVTVTAPASTTEPAIQTVAQAVTVTAPTSTLDSTAQTALQAATNTAPTSTLNPAVQTAAQNLVNAQETYNVNTYIKDNVDIPSKDVTSSQPISKKIDIAHNLVSQTPKLTSDIIPPLASNTNSLSSVEISSPPQLHITSAEFLTAYSKPFNINAPAQGTTDAAIDKTLTALTPIHTNEIETSGKLHPSAAQEAHDVDAYIDDSVDIPTKDATSAVPISKNLDISHNLVNQTPKIMSDIITPLAAITNPIADTTVKAPQAFTITTPTSTLHPAVQTVARSLVKAQETQSGISVRLDPPEMGRVFIDFQFEADQGVRAIIRYDVAETAILLKDKAEFLHQVLKDSGFDSVDLSFEKNDSSDQKNLDFTDEENTPSHFYNEQSDEDIIASVDPNPQRYKLSTQSDIDVKL